MICLCLGEISAVGLDPSLQKEVDEMSEEDDVAGFVQNQNPNEKKSDGKRTRPTSSSDRASSSQDDQQSPEAERQTRQRLLEADGIEESPIVAGPAPSSTSSCLWPMLPCCTCGQGNPNAFRVGCRGPGCRHSVCTACAYNEKGGNLNLCYCVHCVEPERQRRIGWANIGSSC